jgi:SAM-dependent methyltransferase
VDNSYEIQRRLSKLTNYHRWIYESFRSVLGRRILDAGSGYGNITQFLLDDRELVVGLDHSQEFYRAVSERFSGRPGFRAVLGNLADPAVFESLKSWRIDTVVCLNVLEHVEDDRAALRNFHEVLVDSGRLILLVPAFRFLFGSMDRADGHFRRYTRRELAAKVSERGFSIESLRYMNLLGILGWFWNGRVLRRQFISEFHYAAYDQMVPVLRTLERRIRIPAGLSLLLAARKARALERPPSGVELGTGRLTAE